MTPSLTEDKPSPSSRPPAPKRACEVKSKEKQKVMVRSARHTPRNAITLCIIDDLHREWQDSNGEITTRMVGLARKLTNRAIEDGDIGAIREILDRVEGKPKQSLEIPEGTKLAIAVYIPPKDEIIDVTPAEEK